VSAHHVQLTIFGALIALVTVLGYAAARWRRPDTPDDLQQWGLGGRAFGNFVTWFLISGDVYTAYTFVAVPALVFAVGAAGFFAVPFGIITYPVIYLLMTRLWSVSHVHGFITPCEFVRARFGSRTLAALVAITGIVATMPYIALQLVGLEAVLKVMGVHGHWPLTVAFVVVAGYTFKSGLRAPALISIVKDVLMVWTVLAAIVVVAMLARGWHGVFADAATRFAHTPSHGDGLVLPSGGQLGYVTLVVGSAWGLFLYPHAQTGFLAARNRRIIKRNMAGLPIYTCVLGIMALLGFVAASVGVRPLDGDSNTIVPVLFDTIFPAWCAGLAFAAIGIGALVPAAIMSIAAANLFTRGIYREFFRPHASVAEETMVSKLSSLAVKAGAIVAIFVFAPQFSVDLQLIGGVIMLQALPAVAIGLYTSWLHRWALVAGLVSGLAVGLILLYRIPQLGPDGRVIRSHFGGSAWPLAHLGLHTEQTVYVGIVAVLVNLAVAAVGTVVLRAGRVPDGIDITGPHDYVADEGEPTIHRMTELVDGNERRGAHVR
jgi:SSS family solute:Na+ symporter